MKKLNLITEEIDELVINIREEDIDMEFINDMDEVEVSDTTNDIFRVIESGSFVGKAIYLCSAYDYLLGKDSAHNTILVPLKKGTLG